MEYARGVLQGKKTYVVSIIGLVTVVCSYLTGDITLGDAIQGVITSITAMTIRSGISSGQ